MDGNILNPGNIRPAFDAAAASVSTKMPVCQDALDYGIKPFLDLYMDVLARGTNPALASTCADLERIFTDFFMDIYYPLLQRNHWEQSKDMLVRIYNDMPAQCLMDKRLGKLVLPLNRPPAP